MICFACMIWLLPDYLCPTEHQDGVESLCTGNSMVPNGILVVGPTAGEPRFDHLQRLYLYRFQRCVTEPQIPGIEDRHLCTGLRPLLVRAERAEFILHSEGGWFDF